MPTPARNNHASSVQIQQPRTRSPLPPSPIAFKEQQGRPPPTTQQTITGKLFRNLFKGLLFSQLTLTSLLVIVLTIRGLILASSHHFHPKKWYPPLLASVAVSGVASLAWQCIFIYNPPRAVRATFWLSPILTCSVGILLVLIGTAVDAGVGAVFVLFAITQSLYGCWITTRLEYTDKILSLSTAFPPARTREVTTLSIFISVVYSGFLVTGIGGATSTRTNLDLLFISVILIGLAWTMQVLKNAQQVAISRARYVNFAHGEDMDAWSALLVTVKHLTGSICIGSTLVPITVLIRGSIRSVNLMSGSSDEVMYSGADCFSTLANKMVTCGNRWGFVHVGTYDKGFVEASSDTWKKFRSHNGLEKVIDSDLTSSLCFLSAVSVGAVSSLTAGIWVLLVHKDYAFEVTLYAFIIGYFVGRVGLAWLQACVLAYYVAYSEDPQNIRFDGTIPQRIQRFQMLRAHRDNREHEVGRDRQESDESP
ncbi:hypothetical protein Bca52824_067725 [Brassica carinata]|uniref:Choline transporter-like protein n=1 Tax=Brassica carinata TaxID=52824 RepID=A0A8X7QMH3_BRACI|nr:hypothetical protein Bca52824_067725 [Brassica carinata]